MWIFEDILDHRWTKDPKRKGRIDVLIKWEGYEEPTWEPMENIKKDDPVTLAKYAENRELLEQSMWKWARRYVKNQKKFIRMMRQLMAAKRKARGIKYQFGVRVPNSIKEAYELDKANKNTLWEDAIKKEVDLLLNVFECFKVVTGFKTEITDEYQNIPLLWTFAVKFDGRRRARLVAGGHVTTKPVNDYYSGVVELETIRIAFVAAVLMKLHVVAADIASAYIQAFTSEKVYTKAGPEFGKFEGMYMIIAKVLYGLLLSGAMWHQKLADCLRNMGFIPCKADHDLWIRDRGDHYEYVAVIVDDLLIFSQQPNLILEPLQKIYNFELKGVGSPEYYSGADVEFDKNIGLWKWSAKTYIKNVCTRLEKLLEVTLKNYGSPMEAGDHPELDETDLLYGNDISIYQMMIGCAQWAVTLGRFDIQYATNTLARFGQNPRHGHYMRLLRLFGYLKYNAKARILFDGSDPTLDGIDFEINNDWTDIYPNAQEALPDDMPTPKTNKKLKITVFVDTSHATCLKTRRSVTGIIICIGKTPIEWYSKRQNTVESATYGSELVAARIAVELLLEIRYKLRMMGIDFEQTSVMLCDNKAVVTNMELPSSTLKKKHNAVAYHKCQEAVAATIVIFGHIPGDSNISDIETKPLGPCDYYKYLKAPLYGK